MSILFKTYRKLTEFKCEKNKYSWAINSRYKTRLLTSEREDHKVKHNKIHYNFCIKDY